MCVCVRVFFFFFLSPTCVSPGLLPRLTTFVIQILTYYSVNITRFKRLRLVNWQETLRIYAEIRVATYTMNTMKELNQKCVVVIMVEEPMNIVRVANRYL